MLKLFFYALILIYPFYLFVFTKDDLLFNRIWGGVILLYIISHVFSVIINLRKKNIDLFFKTAITLLFTMSLSLIVNSRVTFIDTYQVIKLTTVFFVASILYQYMNINIKTLKIIYYLSFFYLIIFLLAILLRLFFYNINIIDIIKYRDDIWFNRPVIFAFFYSSFLFLFIYISFLFNKNKYLKYIFFFPFFILGARSVLFGSLIILIIFFLNDFTRLSSKFITYISTFLIIVSAIIIYSDFDTIYTQNETIRSIIGSERDNVSGENTDYSINSFSSGRYEIINIYIDDFKPYKFFFGEGGLNLTINIGNHNEFLDYFFMYGIFALIAYLWFYIYKILFNLFLDKSIKNRKINALIYGYVLFALLQSLTNPFTPTLSTIYFFLIIIIHLKITEQIKTSDDKFVLTKWS